MKIVHTKETSWTEKDNFEKPVVKEEIVCKGDRGGTVRIIVKHS